MMRRRLYFLSRPYFYASFDHFFRERLVPGALMLLDDYAYRGHRPQKVAMDRFAQTRANKILSLPTGQGLLIKPAHLY
jgi:hypothetical protein